MKRREATVDEILKMEYVNLTELGKLFGIKSHTAGRRLEALGLWIPNGKATRKALDEKLINRREYDSGCEYPLNTWDRQKTVAILVAAGHRLKKAVQARSTQVVSKYIIPSVKKAPGGTSTP